MDADFRTVGRTGVFLQSHGLLAALLVIGFGLSSVLAQTPSPTPPPDRGLGLPSDAKQSLSQETPNPMTSRPELVLQAGHTKPVTAVAFSTDGHWLASGSGDNTIKVWDVTTGNVLRTLEFGNPVAAIAISPDGASPCS